MLSKGLFKDNGKKIKFEECHNRMLFFFFTLYLRGRTSPIDDVEVVEVKYWPVVFCNLYKYRSNITL